MLFGVGKSKGAHPKKVQLENDKQIQINPSIAYMNDLIDVVYSQEKKEDVVHPEEPAPVITEKMEDSSPEEPTQKLHFKWFVDFIAAIHVQDLIRFLNIAIRGFSIGSLTGSNFSYFKRRIQVKKEGLKE